MVGGAVVGVGSVLLGELDDDGGGNETSGEAVAEGDVGGLDGGGVEARGGAKGRGDWIGTGGASGMMSRRRTERNGGGSLRLSLASCGGE